MEENIKVTDFEVFNFANNNYTEFENNGKKYLLNQHPYLDVVLTDHCNANCGFCIADLIHDKLIADMDIFKQKIKYAQTHLNVDEVLLLGGEPTMNKNLVPIITWLKEQNLNKIIITTNGIRLGDDVNYCEEVMSSGLTHVNISFMNIDKDKQKEITNSKSVLNIGKLAQIYEIAKKHNVKVRINNNIFKGNNDTTGQIFEFYNMVKDHCDSVKFSPLFRVDDFSVVNVKTEWVNNHILDDDKVENLFHITEQLFAFKYQISIIENPLQFGFVKNTMIPLATPIIMNWNFGKYTGMMEKVTKENKINNIKLLPNNELSLSWNREATQYYIDTKI